MSDNDNRLYFVAFCIEQYKASHKMSGADVARLFDREGVDNYLEDNYDVLHTQGASWLVADIDDYIKEVKA